MVTNAPRKMKSKFISTCTACKGVIKLDEPILWTRGAGAKHQVCPALDIAVAAAIVTAPSISVASVVTFLADTKTRGLKAPKARFLSPTGGELRVSLAGGFTKYPGAVQVKIDERWVGRILADGTIAGPLTGMPEVIATLKVIGTDPAAAASAYGHLMGRCSFCNLALTDAGSVEVGYGYVCAKKRGLPYKSKGTPILTKSVPIEASF
jgi:hypothetical protein